MKVHVGVEKCDAIALRIRGSANERIALPFVAIAAHDSRVKNLWFDVTTVVRSSTTPEQAQRIATRIRQIGISRIIYGSDAPAGGNPPPREGWAAFRHLPLTDKEFKTIAENVAPYMRW